nr:MAG TPA: hypothetical protein [Caudoviricetes sp.]
MVNFRGWVLGPGPIFLFSGVIKKQAACSGLL